MASDCELDRNAIFEKFASIKRMHDEVGRKQTEDYQKRLQKLKEEESSYMAKLLMQPISNRSQQETLTHIQNSARRDLFLSSKNTANQFDGRPEQQLSFKNSNRSSTHHQDSYDNGDCEWNIDDDFQPLNITDNEILDERVSNRITHDDEPDDSYITAYHQLLQAHQQQQTLAQQEQENMLSTIFEASCEEATPMTSLVDVHQQHLQASPPVPSNPMSEDNHTDEEQEEDEEEEHNGPIGPSYTSIDDIPASTNFARHENLKYSEYILEKLKTEKDDAFKNQSQGIKEKRPFLKKRQGLAHYQAPPKRRQPCPKTTDTSNNIKTEPVKRPTSASSTNSNSRSTSAPVNQRARSNSSSASIVPNRPTSTAARSSSKSKPVKPINNMNSTRQSNSMSAQSSLLGKVDLDDEDDLLTKYHSKQKSTEHADNDDEFTKTIDKFNSNIQTMIDSKWKSHKPSFHHDEQEQVDHDSDEHMSYSATRQCISDRHSSIPSKTCVPPQPNDDLDDFEKIEQYAEEHPSMISTASFVDKVVFQEDQQAKTMDVFVNRLAHYHKEELDESNDFPTNINRIRQRKVIPLKTKVEARIEPATLITSDDNDDDDDDGNNNNNNNDNDDDDDDEEKHKWDDVEVAKVIPVVVDEYNSDSGISTFKTDFSKTQFNHQKKDSTRSSDFGDDQSWADRVNGPQLNTLMLNTFPGLRHTVPTPAPVPPPPPPPPSSSTTETNQDYSRLVREKAKELEKQIELFEKENAKLQSLCNERNSGIKKLKQDRDEFEKTKQREIEEFNKMKEEEMKKLKQEKRLFEQHRQQLREHPDKREREEIELLKKQVSTLQDDLKQRETRWSTTVNRLKERIETLEYENAELKQEKDIIERKRLELVHQLQTMPKQQVHDDASTRKSLVELQQTKPRSKTTVPTTTKTQPLPKAMVVRNSEPPAKPKVTTNGRRTPTAVIGVNGIKNNVDTSRKLSTLPTTKRTPSMTDLTGMNESMPVPTIIEPAMVTSERADSGHGGSDDDSNRFDRKIDERLSPPIPALMNTDFPKTFIDNDESHHSTTLDYKSLLNMATRTTTSATTLLQRHRETMSGLDQSAPRQHPVASMNHDSVVPKVTSVNTKTTAFKENITMPITNGFIEEIRHSDGRVERVKPDLSKQIVFPNGSRQEISADGKQIRVYFYNGDYKEKQADGRCIYKYASTNTTETEYPDGTHVYEFPNGQIEKHLPDGRQEHLLPDKTKNIYLADGTIISIKTNGEKYIQHPNQTKEVHTDTYKRKLFPNGSILTVFNTGEQEIRYANGKIKIKDAQGNIIVEKKNLTNKINK